MATAVDQKEQHTRVGGSGFRIDRDIPNTQEYLLGFP